MTLPPFSSRRRKISVEVYFVLYLSAIVLLLGTTTTKQSSSEAELEEAIVQMLAPDFRVDAEKVALIYRFVPAWLASDTAAMQPSRDSVNIIRARGSFSDVEFRIVAIEDTITGQTLPIESATLEREGGRSAAFTWRPSGTTLENAVYRVTVAAVATPLPPSNIARPEIRERIAEILRRHRVSDSVTFTVNVFAINSLAMLREAQMPPSNLPRDTASAAMAAETLRTIVTQPGSSDTESEFYAVDNVVRVAPRSSWSNRVMAVGVLNPTVSSGNAQITATSSGLITVSGIAPAAGEQQVVVEGTRFDGRRLTARFTVNTRPLDDPKVPQVIWPDTRYLLDFSSEGVASDQISVDVFLNGKKIVNRENVSARFFIQPESTGELTFVRYVGDQQTGKFTYKVVPLPRPEVGKVEFRPGENAAMLRTTSYGYVDRRANTAELKISEGNAFDPELVSTQTDEANMKHTQTWRIRQRDERNPFWFEVHAIDQRGSGTGKSASIRFNE